MMERPYTPDQLRARLHDIMQGRIEEITRGHKGVIIGKMNEACGGDDNRYRLLWNLFPEKRRKWANYVLATTKDLTDEEWYALSRWINVVKNESTMKWEPHTAFWEEVQAVLAEQVEEEYVEVRGGERKPEQQIMAELGYAAHVPAKPFIPDGISMPVMSCGHEADKYTPTGRPYCSLCIGKIQGVRNE